MKNTTNTTGRRTALSLALMAAFSSQIAVAEPKESIELGVVHVEGDQLSNPTANDVSAEQIEKSQANSLGDLFKRSPEVEVGGGLDVGQRIYIRGVEDTMLNITIDGANQTQRLFHHTGRLSIEPELLKAVDVQAGTGNALSGPGALGGAVRFTTKDPEDMLRPGEDFGALVKGMFSSNTDSFKTNTSLFGRINDDWSGMLSYTRFDQDDYEDGDGNTVPGTETDQDFLFAKVVGHLTDSQTVRLSYEERTDEGDRLMRPQWGGVIDPIRNPILELELERKTLTFNYELNPVDNPFLNLSATVFNTETELFQGQAVPYYGKGKSTGFDIRNTSILGMHTVTYGVDYRKDETLAGPETDKNSLDVETKVMGAYVQDDIQLTEQLLLTAGIRYDDYDTQGSYGGTLRRDGTRIPVSDVDDKVDDFSSNVGLHYQATESLNLYTSYSEAFRGPVAPDAFVLSVTEGIDNNLSAEQSENYEIGAKYDAGDWFGSAKIYRTDIDNLIGSKGFPRIYGNVGDLELRGYVLEMGHRWERLQASLSFHHKNAEIGEYDANVYDHSGFAVSTGDTWTTGLDYQLSPELALGWTGRFVQRLNDIETSLGEIDKAGYGVHDVYAEWVPMAYPDLKVNLSVNNLFDKQYLDQSTNGDFSQYYSYIVGAPERGRDVRLSVAYQF